MLDFSKQRGGCEINKAIVFPIKKVNDLRKQAIKIQQETKCFVRGWSKSQVDPMELLQVFSSLRLKKGMILRAYQFCEGGNGIAFCQGMQGIWGYVAWM